MSEMAETAHRVQPGERCAQRFRAESGILCPPFGWLVQLRRELTRDV
jgi:hypothetical protein